MRKKAISKYSHAFQRLQKEVLEPLFFVRFRNLIRMVRKKRINRLEWLEIVDLLCVMMILL